MAGMPQMSSAETSRRNWASSLRAPFAWFFSAIVATTYLSRSSSTP